MTHRDRTDPTSHLNNQPNSDFDEIIAHYVERLTDGHLLDPDAIREEHPEIAEQLLSSLEAFVDIAPAKERDPEQPLGTLGDYTLRRQIGRGGMGVVYDAWENSLDRRVALKVLPPGVAADARSSTRFLREAQIAAKLSHPHIVPVHATGIKDNTPWYAMEFVEGQTLAQIVPELKEAEPESETVFGRKDEIGYFGSLARSFAMVADGLQHAHSKGVIHRDVKPSNLILDSDGRVRILDFGLARLEGQESITVSGDFVGTPLYMSPEQARQRKIQVDHRTDIYSLGATIYEMLTGRPPFKGTDHKDTLSQIIDREPVEPRKLNARVPRNLEVIVLKCLRKDAGDRYGTAEALAQDLRRFIRGDLVEAKAPEKWRKWVRWAVRNRWRAAVTAVVVLALFLCGLALHFNSETRRKMRDVLESPSASVSDPLSCLKDIFQIVGAEEAAGSLWRLLEQGEQDSSLWTIWLALTLSDLGRSPSDLLEKVSSLDTRDGMSRVARDGASRVRWADWLLGNLAEGKPLRINCGYCPPPDQPDHIELDGENWFRDCFFRGGVPGSGVRTVDLKGTQRPELYRTARGWGVAGGYSIPVPPGRYAVRLHFAQTRESAPGERVYNIYVDGSLVLRNYDTVALKGFRHVDIQVFTVDVIDGILDIQLRTVAGYSLVAGIEIEPLG